MPTSQKYIGVVTVAEAALHGNGACRGVAGQLFYGVGVTEIVDGMSGPDVKEAVHVNHAEIKGVIFDLDGVVVSTDEFHYRGWQRLADEEGIYFDRHINERLRGVSRMDSLLILLERAGRDYSEDEKRRMTERKNGYYKELLRLLTPRDILPGAMATLTELKARNVKVAIGSASRNTPGILDYIGLGTFFDAVADGNCITKSKPDPEVFLKAAEMLGIAPRHCLVVEDAVAGVEAALAGGMRVLAVGFAAQDPRATLRAKDLTAISVDEMLRA